MSELEALDTLTRLLPDGISIQHMAVHDGSVFAWSVTGLTRTDRPCADIGVGDGAITVAQHIGHRSLHVRHYGKTRAEAMSGAADLAVRASDLLADSEEGAQP